MASCKAGACDLRHQEDISSLADLKLQSMYSVLVVGKGQKVMSGDISEPTMSLNLGLYQEEAAGGSSGETPCKVQKSMSTDLTYPKGGCCLPGTQVWDVAETLKFVQYLLFQST